LRRGATVTLLDVDEEAVRAAADVLGAHGTTHAVVCDMADCDAIYAAAARALEAMGGVDILVNNAGIVSAGPLAEVSEARHTLTFMVNTLGVTRMTRAILPSMMAQQRGHIVNVASAAGLTGVAMGTTYSASKWAVVGFSESLHYELRFQKQPIKVSTICPGYVDTGMFDGVRAPHLMPLLQPEEVVAKMVEAIEADRLMVTLPPLVHAVPALRGIIPASVRAYIADKLGVTRSMETWTGHGQ